MTQDRQYRHELKYKISYPDYLAMRSRLRPVMKADPHAAAGGRYLVRSIYFDNLNDKALREKIDGVAKREKFRIRYYNDDLSYIVLEKKMKIGSLCLKCSAPITEEECRKILSGGRSSVTDGGRSSTIDGGRGSMRNGDLSFMKEHPQELVRELYAKMTCQLLRPRVLVSYTREPFIYQAGNVRVTFDSDIRTSLFHQEFLTKEAAGISATDEPQDVYLEVKFDAFLPEVVQDLIRVKGIRQHAFSKYSASRRFG